MGRLLLLAWRFAWTVLRRVEMIEDRFSSGLRPDYLYITHYNNSNDSFSLFYSHQPTFTKAVNMINNDVLCSMSVLLLNQIKASIIFQRQLSRMSNYRKIADEFSRIGYRETARLNEYQINNALDKIVQANINQAEFNREVALELFQQTEKDSANTVQLRDYINTILTAHSVLDKHIKECQRRLDGASDVQKRELVENIQQFQEDYQLLSTPFHITAVRSQRLAESALDRNSFSRSKDKSGIFADQPSAREESGSLKLVLILTLVCFILEIMCVFVRHHFLNLLGYVLVLSIFFLNYFDKYTIKTSLVVLGVAVLFDLVWLIAQANPYWNSNGQTQHSTLQPGFLKTVYLFTVILMVAKAVIGLLLYRFRNNDDQTRKSVRFLNLRFDLDGTSQASPIARIIEQRPQARNSAYF